MSKMSWTRYQRKYDQEAVIGKDGKITGGKIKRRSDPLPPKFEKVVEKCPICKQEMRYAVGTVMFVHKACRKKKKI